MVRLSGRLLILRQSKFKPDEINVQRSIFIDPYLDWCNYTTIAFWNKGIPIILNKHSGYLNNYEYETTQEYYK